MIENILAERQKTHGDFAEHAMFTQKIKRVMALEDHSGLNDTQREALEMIAHKIGRILAGNPHYKDHWSDIAGYATLIANELPD